MIPATALILVVSTMAQIPGKPQDEARIHKMLFDEARSCLVQKDDPRLVARGAWLAARYRLGETRDLLLARLKREGKWTLEWDFAQHFFYRRSVREESQFCTGLQPERKEGWDRQRLVWLYALAGSERKSEGLRVTKSLSVDLRGYASACKRERNLAHTVWQDLISTLRKQGRYQGKVPRLRIRWRIQDMRKQKQPPLAALPWMKDVELIRERR